VVPVDPRFFAMATDPDSRDVIQLTRRTSSTSTTHLILGDAEEVI
jgi:hypothetical protein